MIEKDILQKISDNHALEIKNKIDPTLYIETEKLIKKGLVRLLGKTEEDEILTVNLTREGIKKLKSF